MNLLFLSVNSNTDRYVEEIKDNLSKYRIKFNSWKYDGKTLFLNSGKKKTIPCISFNYLNNLSNTDLLFNRSRIREMINSCKEEIKELKITHLVTFNDFYGLNYIMIKLCNELNLETIVVQDGILFDNNNFKINKFSFGEFYKFNSMRLLKTFDYHFMKAVFKFVFNFIIRKLSSEFCCSVQQWGYGSPLKYILYSDNSKNIILKNNNRDSMIYVAGSPYSNKNINNNLEFNKLYSELHISSKKQTILIIDQNFRIHGTWNRKEEELYYKLLFNVCKELPDVNIVIKYKRRFQLPDFIRNGNNLPKNFYFTVDYLDELISVSNIVLSVHSTVLVEALDSKKRIGCFDWFTFSNPFIESDIAFSISNFNPKKIAFLLRKELKFSNSINLEEQISSFNKKMRGDSSLDFFSGTAKAIGNKS